MNPLLVAVVSVATITLAVNLGLTESIASVLMKIAKCPKCCSFWGTMAILVLSGCRDILLIAFLSILASYASHWFGLIIMATSNAYERLWERLRKSPSKAKK